MHRLRKPKAICVEKCLVYDEGNDGAMPGIPGRSRRRARYGNVIDRRLASGTRRTAAIADSPAGKQGKHEQQQQEVQDLLPAFLGTRSSRTPTDHNPRQKKKKSVIDGAAAERLDGTLARRSGNSHYGSR